MNEALVTTTEALDRHLFVAGFVLTIVMSGLKVFGVIQWPWLWITAPLWIWIGLTALRAQFIVRPWRKQLARQAAASRSDAAAD
jgi:hypothetical protein